MISSERAYNLQKIRNGRKRMLRFIDSRAKAKRFGEKQNKYSRKKEYVVHAPKIFCPIKNWKEYAAFLEEKDEPSQENKHKNVFVNLSQVSEATTAGILLLIASVNNSPLNQVRRTRGNYPEEESAREALSIVGFTNAIMKNAFKTTGSRIFSISEENLVVHSGEKSDEDGNTKLATLCRDVFRNVFDSNTERPPFNFPLFKILSEMKDNTITHASGDLPPSYKTKRYKNFPKENVLVRSKPVDSK